MLTTTTMMICEDSISAIMLSSYGGLWRRRSHFHRLGREIWKKCGRRVGVLVRRRRKLSMVLVSTLVSNYAWPWPWPCCGPWSMGFLSSGQRTVDDGQTIISVLFHLSVWPSNVVPYRAGGQRTVDDGQTNSVLYHLSVWPSNVIPYFTSPLNPTNYRLCLASFVLFQTVGSMFQTVFEFCPIILVPT